MIDNDNQRKSFIIRLIIFLFLFLDLTTVNILKSWTSTEYSYLVVYIEAAWAVFFAGLLVLDVAFEYLAFYRSADKNCSSPSKDCNNELDWSGDLDRSLSFKPNLNHSTQSFRSSTPIGKPSPNMSLSDSLNHSGTSSLFLRMPPNRSNDTAHLISGHSSESFEKFMSLDCDNAFQRRNTGRYHNSILPSDKKRDDDVMSVSSQIVFSKKNGASKRHLMKSLTLSQTLDRLNLTTSEVNSWTEKIRQWLSQNIFKDLTRRIDKIETYLQSHGHSIYTTPIAVLRGIGVSKINEVPDLYPVLAFLDLPGLPSHNIVINRIKALADGGCLWNFEWENFGQRESIKEKKSFDCDLVMGCFSAFMDSQLPDYGAGFETGLTQRFSRQLCSASAEEPQKNDVSLLEEHLTSSSLVQDEFRICIDKFQSFPSQFRVVTLGERRKERKVGYIYEPLVGPDNVFSAIGLFLLLVGRFGGGKMAAGKLNLGKKGLNILTAVNIKT